MPKGSVVKMRNAYVAAGTPHSRHMLQEWEHNLRVDATTAMNGREPSTSCIRFMCEFQMPVPKTTIRKDQLGWLGHTKKPDVDKLLRAVLDALTGIVWVDDSQVAFATANKTFAWNGRPGAHIIIDFWSDEVLQQFADSHRRVTDAMESL